MALGRGLNLVVLINGVSQVLLQDVRVTADGKKIEIEGKNSLLGFTPGAKSLTISFKSAVMVEGPEFDPFDAAEGSDTYEVQVPYGTKTLTSQGEFLSAEIGQSVNASTELSFEFRGTFEKPR